MNKVAITGIGIVSCIGTGIKKVTESIKKGKSGIVFDPKRKEVGLRSGLTGKISDFTPPAIDRKKMRTMTEFGIQCYAAALEAIQMAGWTDEDVRSEKTGLIVGNDSSTLANVKQVEITNTQKSTFNIGASMVFQALNSTVTMNLNAILGNKGASWSISGACASGGHAIGQASDLITFGRQDRIICGGVQEINWEAISSFDATNAFSIREKEPEKASRPFDKDRDGLIPSGGAAVVLLENYDMAKKRGADILGTVSAYAFSSDGSHLAIPTGEGLYRCMKECLQRGNIPKEKVDYISAHATSTPVGDAVEAQMIYNVFGSEMPHVSSMKSMVGHEMWMAGASQVVYSLIMGREGFIAPNLNFSKQEDGIPKLNLAIEIIDKKPKIILCNSAGFGGTNASLLIETK